MLSSHHSLSLLSLLCSRGILSAPVHCYRRGLLLCLRLRPWLLTTGPLTVNCGAPAPAGSRARTHRSWSRPVTTVSPVTQCVDLWSCPRLVCSLAASTNMKSKFDSGRAQGCGCGEPSVAESLLAASSGTQGPGRHAQPSSDIITSSQTHTHTRGGAVTRTQRRLYDSTFAL